LVSAATEAVLAEVRAWQARPLDAVYPILYLDALIVKVKENGRVINKAVYLVIGVSLQGLKEILGIWIAETEGASFWLSIITELKNRGVEDIFIACVDGLKGFPEAIEAVYPKTQVQLCLVHLVRHSLSYVSYKARKEVAADLKLIYRAATLEEAETRLLEMVEKWETRYPVVARSWQSNWARIVPMFSFTPEIRRAIYTTNAIESLNFSLRKIIKNRALFPNDDAVLKILFLALRNIAKKWTMPIPDWSAAMNQFAILFEKRVPINGFGANSFTQIF
jgi:putative transposase